MWEGEHGGVRGGCGECDGGGVFGCVGGFWDGSVERP
jgi:hypothetical protein